MKERRKPRFARPDEVFSRGPLRMARFGQNVVLQSDWPADEFASMQRGLVEQYPKVVQEIDQLIADIAQLVTELPPDQLLHRAWWEMAGKHIKIESEFDVGPDEAISIRMIDYVQSVIAAVEPSVNQRKEITEEDWHTLRTKVGTLFQTINSTYQICLSAKNKAEAPNLDRHFEEFKFKAQLYWCNIRGHRYQVHQPAYLRDMFLPHSDVLKALFGITAEVFIESFIKIWHNLSFGLSEAFQSLAQFRTAAGKALESKLGAQTGLSPEKWT